jgi:predicted metal-dependent hydrolase
MTKKQIENLFEQVSNTLGISASLEWGDFGNSMGLANAPLRKIGLSIFLLLRKEIDIKYIIIHELAHIKTWTPKSFHGKLFKKTEKKFLDKFGIIAKYKDGTEYPYVVEYQ